MALVILQPNNCGDYSANYMPICTNFARVNTSISYTSTHEADYFRTWL